MLRPLRRSTDRSGRRLRRGVYLLPSMFTIGNMFCGYACIVHAMRGEFHIAAPFIGFAMVLDMLDGRIARMTGTASDFGIELDSLADVISFGMAPAILSFTWGLQPLGRLGWAVGFLFVAAAALRLARFNIQAGSVDKRYFVGMPSPAAAAVPAATVFAYPYGFTAYTDVAPDWLQQLASPLTGFATVVLALPVIAMVLVPALLMVSTIRFRSFKTFDLSARRSYTVLLLVAIVFALFAAQPDYLFVVLAYGYLLSAFVEFAWSRLRRRPAVSHEAHEELATKDTKITKG
jgi:CDP-diacylglycerol---serine O-phosphatidyltransferase